MVQRRKWERLCQKVLENLSMGTVHKMGTPLPKGVRKFVNGYSAEKYYKYVNRIYGNNNRFYRNLL